MSMKISIEWYVVAHTLGAIVNSVYGGVAVSKR